MCYVAAFQISYRFWRLINKLFWLVVVVYSIIVLVALYTYQFDNVPELITNYTSISEKMQNDLGELCQNGFRGTQLLREMFNKSVLHKIL